jgi:hypothetical protein
MSPEMQRRKACEAASRKRAQITALKQQLLGGTLTLEDVLMDPPEALTQVPVIDVLRMTRRAGNRGARGLWQINGRAVHAGVNLMMPLGLASERTREWAAENGSWYMNRPAGA